MLECFGAMMAHVVPSSKARRKKCADRDRGEGLAPEAIDWKWPMNTAS